MSTSSTNHFDSLPARPPTPPRDIQRAIDDAISFLDESNEVEQLISRSVPEHQRLNASKITPSSSQEATSLSNLSKKVGFSPHPVYYKISLPDQSSSPSWALLKRSPSTAKDAKPLKSILKLSHAPPPSPEDLDTTLSFFSPAEPGSFAKMLQSVCKELAGPSRSSRLDAYTMLNNALKTYDNVPDTTAMVQKMHLLTQFLSRDIQWKATADTLDTQTTTQALNLTYAILSRQELSDALDDDFSHLLIDRSITILEQSNVPKQIVKSYMSVLFQQQFRTIIMNAGRADRLLSALQSIEDRCSGNGVVAQRLAIYARLLEQTPVAMLAKVRDWLCHVFHGMLSSIKDVRVRAVDACNKVGVCLGQQAHLSKVFIEILDTAGDDGQTYFDFLKARLFQMISDDELGPYVPQIWSAILFMFRSKKYPLHAWVHFTPSLLIIQRCLNASDLKVRYQATLAWNKFVFTIMPNSTTSRRTMNLLPLWIISTMEKPYKDKTSKYFRQYALDSYYNLLHYGLRPTLSAEELDNAWDSFVRPVLSGMVRAGGKGRHTACRVLRGLLNGNTGVWNGNAALDPTPIRPEDLPKLEPKWVRSRLAKFLKVLEPALQDMGQPDEADHAVDATWHSLMQALASARSQEVRTTIESKEAIALLVALFRRLWIGCTPPVDRHRWIKRYGALLDATMDGIGISSFTEDILATTEDNAIEVAPTPSHRTSKQHSAPTSPLVILIGPFYHIPTGLVAGEAYFSSALTIMDRALSSKVTAAASLELVCRSLHSWTDSRSLDVQPLIRREMWIVAAKASVRVLKAELNRLSTQETQPLGHALRSGVDILNRGLVLDVHARLLSMLSELYDALFEIAKSVAGDAGVVLAVMEPLAKAFMDANAQIHFKTKLHMATRMLERTTWPKNRQALDQARKSLWGVGLTPIKTTLFDPFEQVYLVIVEVMTTVYNDFGSTQAVDMESLEPLVSSVLTFLKSSPMSLLATALRKVQFGLRVWIEDNALKTNGNEQMTNMLRSRWHSLVRLMTSIPTKDNNLLKALEPLLVAGFSSPHRAIVNDTIIFWNETFGAEESLEYPAKLEAVLRTRQADAEISLPTFPDADVDHVPASLPTFFDSPSQRTTNLPPPRLIGSNGSTFLSPRGPQHRSHNSPLTTKSSPINRSIASPSSAKRVEQRSTSLTPKPRLRHDDSQIQFAPIDSSPLPPADESQLLTEHQKEVKARQHLDAQLFPDISSSPVAHSTALPRGLPKKLDFGPKISPQQYGEGHGTPTGLADGNVLASDDMPSSPTPSSTKDASQGAMELDDDPNEEAVAGDPPSSPPRATHEDHNGHQEDLETIDVADPEVTTADVSELPDQEQDIKDPGDPDEVLVDVENNDEPVPETDEMFSASEFPSNSVLPDEQLQLEAQIARKSQEVLIDRPDDTQAHHSGDTVPEEEPTHEAVQDEVTRVEDSFVAPASPTNSQPVDHSHKSPRATKKRKRRSAKFAVSKKRVQQAPLQHEQQDDDDDIGENIVVASSQPVSSPAADEPEGHEEAEEIQEAEEDSVVVERSMVVKEEPEVLQPPLKQGRGRPRKSETPTPSQNETAPTKSLKRKASILSNASFDGDEPPTSFVKATPAPTKAKGRAGRPPRRGSSSQASREQSQSRPTSRGSSVVVAVMIPPTPSAMRQAVEEVAAAEEEDPAVVEDRPMLTPRSILRRLKDALCDFKGMILGPQLERQYDNVLFEFRQETHEAGRRGRQA